MRGIIRVGDTHTHGGRVESGAATSKVMGHAVARVGDTCSCLVHGTCTIVEGDPDFNVEGRAAAFDGHKTSCGAALNSSVVDSGRI
ncbi:PAAR domain-containing protein [Burkholderia anthina]|uniref:PAAR domain-containing protein n=1 Tax=Burkholderia anthina TaxID=179879 RepID=A0A6P2G6C6_9BURK|nr:PAAR domain-containing protein [Burkholderia anthina]MBM2767487.1 PAAR domain-containing protein [Burkholderia anthina]VVU49238.1 PAAR motif-containing protein [Burkholderia anthina]